MKIRITKKGLPKAQMWNSNIGKPTIDQNGLVWGSNPNIVTQSEMTSAFGECGPGLVYNDILQKCVTPEEQAKLDKAMQGFRDWRSGKAPNPMKSTGNEGNDSNPMGRGPVEKSSPAAQPKSAYAKAFDAVVNPFRAIQKGLQKPGMQKIYAASSIVNGLTDFALPIATFIDNEKRIKEATYNAELNRYDSYSVAPKFRGNFTINEGLFRPDDRGVNEGMYTNNFYGNMAMYGGSMINDTTNTLPMKVRIKKTPSDKMKYGGQSNYGLDLGRNKVYTDMPDSKSDMVSMYMGAIPRELANIEAEGGETVFGDLDKDGMLEHKTIVGKRHSEGGVPLNVPEGSFIFSDTKKMKIKDPQVLAQFGVSYKKGGVTPAVIAKKYPLNKYKAVLQDPYADDLDKKTAKMNYDNATAKLGMLSMIQESMKNYPQGMPQVAQSALNIGQAAYGGYYLPQYQGSTGASTVGPQLGDWTDDYDALQKLLQSNENAELRKAMYNEFLKNYPKSPLKSDPKGEEKFIANFLNAQQQFMAIGEKYKDKPEILKSKDWDKGGRNVYYNKIAKDMGLTPMTADEAKRFQAGYRALAQAIQKNPKFIESFGQYFDLTPEGVDDQTFLNWPISGAEGWVGNTTIGQKARLRKPLPETKALPEFICKDGKAVPVPAGTAGAYKTADEALKYCPEQPKQKPKYLCIDGKLVETVYGYDTSEEAMQNCDKPGKEIPFDFTLPDKMNIGWKAAMAVPEAIMPTKYNLPGRSYPIAFDDWFSRVQNRQAGYNIAADAASKTNQSQSVGSFLAGLVGAQDVGDISQVNTGNLDRAERRTMADMEADFKRDLFNLEQNKEYDKSVATGRQQYRNSLNQGVTNLIDAYGKGFFRRGEIYDRNRRSKYTYRDPNSWKTIFKGNPLDIFTMPEFEFDALSGMGRTTNTGVSDGPSGLGSAYNNYYSMYLKELQGNTDLTADEKKAEAKKLAGIAVNSLSRRSTNSYDQFGYPRNSSIRTTSFGYNDDDDIFGYGGMFGW